MPKFLSRKELYAIIGRELPPDLYAYSPSASGFLTTSDDDAVAKVFESIYGNMERISINNFPQDADERIGDWEKFVFGEVAPAASGLEFRRERVVAKIRARKGITKADIAELVLLVIGQDKQIEILEASNATGSWVLGVSEIGYSTILSGFNTSSAILTGPDLWEKTAAELGLTEQELFDYKKEAYGYTVRIINYEATAEELLAIEKLLTMYEPARSWHTIENNATLNEATIEWLLGFSELGEGTYL